MTYSFGEWMKQRRSNLRLTQREVAERASCALATIKKFESDERRPSPELAKLLADVLQIPPAHRVIFIECARGERPLDVLTAALDRVVPELLVDLPTGTVTFFLSDIEGSTRLWEEQPHLMQATLARHDEILQSAVRQQDGYLLKNTGDGWLAVFRSAPAAIRATLAAQQTLLAQDWPAAIESLKVRMALHTGTAQHRDGDYFGPPLNRVARLLAVGHGRQILLTQATAVLIRNHLPPQTSLLNLGTYRLKDLSQAEEIFQLMADSLPANFPSLRIPRRGLLPTPATSFIGREKELAEVKRLITGKELTGFGNLSALRLVTLLGPGGTGKTRLSLQAATDLVDQFPDGVWFVELAAITNPDLLPVQLATVLGVQEQLDRSLLTSLVDFLRRKELLLLFDNVEHLIRESATLVEHLLAHCPKIKILVTGREALFIGGETTLQIPSLSLPPSDLDFRSPGDFGTLRHSEAVQLFLVRAQAVRPNFELTPQNASAIAEIVCRLDGIPLALELAAARLPMLSVEQIAGRLNDRFRLLTGGRRTALPRQQTLQALIDWSWNLLNDEERTLLGRLSVFTGGWTLEAAEKISPIESPISEIGDWVFEVLASLVSKSLVIADQPAEGDVRYRMLESVRQYAQERLFEAGEGETLRDRHAAYFAAFMLEADEELLGAERVLWIGRLSQEMDNFRAALEWTVERNPDLALAIGGKLFQVRGYWHSTSEAQRWLEQALEQASKMKATEDDVAHQIHLGVALATLSGVHFGQGHNAEGVILGEEAVRILRSTGNLLELCLALGMKAFAASFAGEWEVARVAAEEAVELARTYNHTLGYFTSMGTLVQIALIAGDSARAAAHMEEWREMSKQINSPWVEAQTAHMEGRIFQLQGKLSQAQAAFERANQLFGALKDILFERITKSEISHLMRQQGDFAGALLIYREMILGILEVGNLGGVAHQLECFGYIAITLEEPERAAKLLGAAQALRAQNHAESVLPWEKADFAQAMTQLTAMLGEPMRDEIMAEGRVMSVDEAVAFALDS